MRSVAAAVCVLTLLCIGQAFAQAATAPMLVRQIITEPGAEPWATVSYPDNCLVVEFKLDPYASAKRDFSAIAQRLVPAALQQFPKIDSVQITGFLTVRDKRGNDHDVQAAMVKFSRAGSASIRWDRVHLDDVIDIADHHAVSPLLR
jgi:hypothetical protein